MKKTIFFRLVRDDNKETALQRAVGAINAGDVPESAHLWPVNVFRELPGTAFSYWASANLRKKFSEFGPFSRGDVLVRQGLATGADFRFLRLAWEIDPRSRVSSSADSVGCRAWVPFAKGGDFAPFYSDLHLCVNWTNQGAEVRTILDRQGQIASRPRARYAYFQPGLTWPLRAHAFSPQARPTGSIFSVRGYTVLAASEHKLSYLLGLSSSSIFNFLFRMLLGRHEHPEFLVGVLQRLPAPDADEETYNRFSDLAGELVSLRRSLFAETDETCSHFVQPGAAASDCGPREAMGSMLERVNKTTSRVVSAMAEVNELAERLYRLNSEDRSIVRRECNGNNMGLPQPPTPDVAAASLVSWALGVALGRFDIRLATGQRSHANTSTPFEVLSAYSPGMLPQWHVPDDYPIQVDLDGILVDDEGHGDDIIRRLDQVMDVLWQERSAAFQREICTLLRVPSLREWFRKMGSGGFWDNHFKRYSKKPRRAPIYWPLQSPRGGYTVWVYYHRLDQDTLPKLLGPKYLGGKIERVKHAITELRPQQDPKSTLSRKDERRLAELDELLTDLEEFAWRIQQVVRLQDERGQTVGWVPDLNDGVVLNAAPLHGMIPWPRKKKRSGKSVSELLAFWQDLEAGKYEWAHIAMRYWPERVTAKCRGDQSLALAHELDGEFFPGLREELREATARGDTEEDEADSDLPYDAEADEEEDEE